MAGCEISDEDGDLRYVFRYDDETDSVDDTTFDMADSKTMPAALSDEALIRFIITLFSKHGWPIDKIRALLVRKLHIEAVHVDQLIDQAMNQVPDDVLPSP